VWVGSCKIAVSMISFGSDLVLHGQGIMETAILEWR